MKFLTDGQKRFLRKKKLIKGYPYLLPRFGFTLYKSPDLFEPLRMDTNPWTKSLDKHPVEIIKYDGIFAQVKFMRPKRNAPNVPFWLKIEDLEKRDVIDVILTSLLCVVPFLLYNVTGMSKRSFKQQIAIAVVLGFTVAMAINYSVWEPILDLLR